MARSNPADSCVSSQATLASHSLPRAEGPCSRAPLGHPNEGSAPSLGSAPHPKVQPWAVFAKKSCQKCPNFCPVFLTLRSGKETFGGSRVPLGRWGGGRPTPPFQSMGGVKTPRYLTCTPSLYRSLPRLPTSHPCILATPWSGEGWFTWGSSSIELKHHKVLSGRC